MAWSTISITDTPHGRRGVSYHKQLDYLFNSLFKLKSKKNQSSHITCLYEGNTRVTSGFPHKGSVLRKASPRHDVIIGYMMTKFNVAQLRH